MTEERGNGRRQRRGRQRPMERSSTRRKLLVLHGNRQTGQLLLGRMDKLRKRLLGTVDLVAPDAPFPTREDPHLRQWWDRHDNDYRGLEESMNLLEQLWEEQSFEGIVGFSQGARLAHLMALCHVYNNKFPKLRYIIFVSGYHAPIPDDFDTICPHYEKANLLPVTSLHVWGRNDALILPDQSRTLAQLYVSPTIHEHDGKHFVPMKSFNVNTYVQFVESAISAAPEQEIVQETLLAAEPLSVLPDEETALVQQEEVEALNAIFPDEFHLISSKDEGNDEYQHPIVYRIDIPESDVGVWPPHPVSLRVEYTPTYPQEMANISLSHDNNMLEFTTPQTMAIMKAIHEAAEAELGMPSVLGCVYAAREFFESGAMATTVQDETEQQNDFSVKAETLQEDISRKSFMLKPASQERIHECNMQGLKIAESLLHRAKPTSQQQQQQHSESDTALVGKGGMWKYCIGLVGKPSAGKSTFFNAATAFARQRGAGDDVETNALGGATMAPHPFTTIDPNVGFCLVPAPPGSCPEEENVPNNIGSTHGRDSKGQRLLPVMLKDVAGLVPGAYQGRGRGNKFLNDLTDADVLIHVVDASGTADTEGNTVGCAENDGSSAARGAGSHPLNDLAWIGDELVQWVFTNLLFKWDTISRRGRSKLQGMFSGYGQNQAVLWDILLAVEKYLDQEEHRDHALDHLDEWDEGDVHRLVSAFLGVRFPMALALNKSDLPSAASYVIDVLEALPVHGAHAGVPLCARKEMHFVRRHLEMSSSMSIEAPEGADSTIPAGVWQCLQSAISLREPVLAFPVCDMTTYAPLPGMTQHATGDASLPNKAMISCLLSAGGSIPSLWDDRKGIYNTATDGGQSVHSVLRDVIVMKPGSTVEDVFLALKRIGALGGEFVRAEGAGSIGEKQKLIPKNEIVGKSNRILKIMTNKRRDWQSQKS